MGTVTLDSSVDIGGISLLSGKESASSRPVSHFLDLLSSSLALSLQSFAI